jgi:hypothetical protein
MNSIFRNFFYAVGMIALIAMSAMNPEAAQFKNMIVLTQMPSVWGAVAGLTMFLYGLERVWSGASVRGRMASGSASGSDRAAVRKIKG